MVVVNSKKVLDLEEQYGITLANLSSSVLSYKCTISVGSTETKLANEELGLNGSLLYQTKHFGLKEIRILGIETDKIQVKIKNISPSHTYFGVGYESKIDDSLISEEDYEKLVINLTSLKEDFIHDPSLSSEQVNYLTAQIDYLAAFAGKDGITKKDFIFQAVGAICNVTVAAVFAPEIAKDIFTGFANSIPWLVDSVVHSYPLLNLNGPLRLEK